ncbi:MAG: cysteine synthase family protein [Candidatus Neomarinimicrobiota bacterium]
MKSSKAINNQLSKLHKLGSLVGNTPLLVLNFRYKDLQRTLYAKAEYMNMTGSIKDRMAYCILEQAYARGRLKAGDLIVEATSGNTGISFCAMGRALGHPVTIFMPDWMSIERINLLKSLGARINLVSEKEGGFLGSIKLSEELAGSVKGAFLPQQFSNIDNITAHYESTGPEIWWQMKLNQIQPRAFVAGVGTGGTIMGVGKYLKEQDQQIGVFPLEPANSPTLSTGCKVGKHRIQGISDEFIPSIINFDSLDSIVGVEDGDSIIMAQKLARELGLGVGISSGANFLGALKIQEKLGPEAAVVTVFSDDNKKYLSTDLLQEEPLKKEYLSGDIELDRVEAINKVCNTCCDPRECQVEHIPGCQGAMKNYIMA